MAPPSPVLGALDPDAPLPFGRHSVVRAVVAEPVTALLVQRALVMEVAHPEVAAAVTHHSQFQRRPLSRAWVTADAALRLVFGDDARGARRGPPDLRRPRPHPRDTLATGRRLAEPADAGYTAHDASLLAWVWATLVDTAETAFTRWVRPFDAAEATSFYAEMRSFARFLGIPDDLLPADRDAFSRLSRGRGRRASSSERATPAGPWRARSCGSNTGSCLLRSSGWSGCSPWPPWTPASSTVWASVPTRADAELGRRLDAWLTAYYRRVPRPPRVLPALYVMLRRPSIGLAGGPGPPWVRRGNGRSRRGSHQGVSDHGVPWLGTLGLHQAHTRRPSGDDPS